MKELTQEKLKELFEFDKEAGVLIWKVSRGTVKAGSVAGSKNSLGYWVIRVDGKNYLAHRLIWCFSFGYFPEHGLDHKNRNKNDNRIENLREASKQCNTRNTGMLSNNTSGIKGVHWCKRGRKWVAQITVNGKRIALGYFPDKLEAAKARHEAEIEHEFPNCQTDSTALAYINAQKI